MKNNEAAAGLAASLAAGALTFLFAVFLVLSLMDPENLFWLNSSFLACLILAPAYAVWVAALHGRAPERAKIWTRVALLFAGVYVVLCALSYFVQLVFVAPNRGILPVELLRLFEYTPGTFLFAANMLGYGFMCLSTLAAAQVFSEREDRVLKILYRIHGALVVPTLVFPGLSVAQHTGAAAKPDAFGGIVLLAWCVLFIPIALFTADWFRKKI